MSDTTAADLDPAVDEGSTNGQHVDLAPYVLDALGDDAATLDADQLARAADAPNSVGGLRGKELRTHILEGPEARKAAKEKRKSEKGKRKGGGAGSRAIGRGHDPWVGEATTRAKAYSAKKPGLAEGAHVPAAGPVQHVKVRHVVEKKLAEQNKPVTADNVLEVAGGISLAELKRIATFESEKPSLKPLRELGSEFGKDGWSKGRYLAAILAVWVEDLRKSEKSKS